MKLVLGPYCDLEWIGGGMGELYRAREPGSGDRTVAIKVPKTRLDPQLAKRRFLREIAASARLTHESVVRTHHRGEEAGRPYLVMEFVAGRGRVPAAGPQVSPEAIVGQPATLDADDPEQAAVRVPPSGRCRKMSCPRSCPRSQAPPGNGPFWQAPPAVLVLHGLGRGGASR